MQEWTPARDAVNKLQTALGGRFAAKLLLADAMRDGLIKARAAATWEAASDELSWKAPEQAERDVTIKRAQSRNAHHWQSDLINWRWSKGNFAITLDADQGLRRHFKGVCFETSGFMKLAEDSGFPLKAKGRGGQPKREDKWLKLWLYMIKIADSGNLDISVYESKAKFLDEVYNKSRSGLARETIKPQVSAVWDTVCKSGYKG